MRALSGKLLIAIGVVHCSVGLWFGFDTARSIVGDGFLDAVEPEVSRMYWFWFMLTGVLMIVLGQLTFWVEAHANKKPPRFLAWEVLALGVVATAAIPASGGWLVIAAGIYMVTAGTRDKKL